MEGVQCVMFQLNQKKCMYKVWISVKLRRVLTVNCFKRTSQTGYWHYSKTKLDTIRPQKEHEENHLSAAQTHEIKVFLTLYCILLLPCLVGWYIQYLQEVHRQNLFQPIW